MSFAQRIFVVSNVETGKVVLTTGNILAAVTYIAEELGTDIKSLTPNYDKICRKLRYNIDEVLKFSNEEKSVTYSLQYSLLNINLKKQKELMFYHKAS